VALLSAKTILTGETATNVPIRIPNIIVPIRSTRPRIHPIVTVTAQYHRYIIYPKFLFI